ncbi:MAG: FtsX-like permease family protein [Pseudomonadota bacterium]|nr:FtsX-like permease family protein [Pseudomonadota bacterium]
MNDVLKIAARNLLRYKRRTFLTCLLITIGLVAVLLFIAVAGSFRDMMVDQFTDSMVGHMQVHRRGYMGARESLPVDRNMRPKMLVKLYEALDASQEIVAWSPRVKFMAMFSNFLDTTSIRVNGVDGPREDATVPLLGKRVFEDGEAHPLVKPGHIQVPELFAKAMRLKVGDTVVLVATNKDGSVNGKTFVIQGIMESISGPGGRDSYIHIDDARDLLRIEDEEVEDTVLAHHGYVTLAEEPEPEIQDPLKLDSLRAETDAKPKPYVAKGYLEETRRLFEEKGWGRPSEVSEIAIRLKDRGRLDDVLIEIEAEVADLKNRKGMTIFQVHPWQTFVPFSKVANMIDVMNLFMKIILVSVVLVSIMNVLIMAVYERIREIGTIAAIGTRPASIMGLFVSEGFLLGVLGTAIGTVIGLATIFILHEVTIPFAFGRQENLVLTPVIGVTDVVTTCTLTILVSVLASFQPAWKASRMDPITALRHV